MSVTQRFIDSATDKVIRIIGERHPGLSIKSARRGILKKGTVAIPEEKITAAMGSIMSGFRPEVPQEIAMSVFAAVSTQDVNKLNEEAASVIGQLVVFGTLTDANAV